MAFPAFHERLFPCPASGDGLSFFFFSPTPLPYSDADHAGFFSVRFPSQAVRPFSFPLSAPVVLRHFSLPMKFFFLTLSALLTASVRFPESSSFPPFSSNRQRSGDPPAALSPRFLFVDVYSYFFFRDRSFCLLFWSKGPSLFPSLADVIPSAPLFCSYDVHCELSRFFFPLAVCAAELSEYFLFRAQVSPNQFEFFLSRADLFVFFRQEVWSMKMDPFRGGG